MSLRTSKFFTGLVFALVIISCTPEVGSGQSVSWRSISGLPGVFTVKKGAGGKLFSAYGGSSNDAKLFASTDNGVSWTETPINSGLIADLVTNDSDIIVDRFVPNQQLPYQFWHSTDNGTTWSRLLGNSFPLFV